MVKTEYFRTRSDGVNLFRTYSDEGFTLIQNETGIEYSEAIDVEDVHYTYSETDKPIEGDTEVVDTDEATEEDYIAALAELGVEE